MFCTSVPSFDVLYNHLFKISQAQLDLPHLLKAILVSIRVLTDYVLLCKYVASVNEIVVSLL